MVCLFDDIDVLHGPNHGIIHYPSSGGFFATSNLTEANKNHQCFLAIQWLGGSVSEPGVFILIQNGEPRSYLEFPNYLRKPAKNR